MKLNTQNGELELPKDFSFTIHRTNPYLSEEGDVSVPAQLPASSNNKKVLQHLHRIDRHGKYLPKIAATLEIGPSMKHGQLVVDSAHATEGFDCSFAIENSDLYSQHKEKTLKEILEGEKETFTDIDGYMDRISDLFEGPSSQNTPFTIFPVAVSKYIENGVEVYQYNNEFDILNNVLIYDARVVREGDIAMSVPKGYGISPFLYLHEAIRRVFEKLGYTIAENCFSSGNAASLVLLNNCADTICKKEINYSDLVPSCTLSDFVDWLLQKFHVGVRVDSSGKKVYVRKMEDLLTDSPEYDITEKLIDNPTVQLNGTKRIIITPNNEIEGTEAAATTLDDLAAKYGGWVEVDEQQFQSLTTGQPAANDCLVLRKATGQFYELLRNFANGAQTPKLLGTNYFTYDRNNADDTEQFSPSDSMPMMIVDPKSRATAPYIGERIHNHTAYGDAKNDTKQEIIICQQVIKNRNEPIPYHRTGTTQKFIPYTHTYNNATGRTLENDLTSYGMYQEYWQHYNDILLNNEVHLIGRIHYSIAEILNMDMATMRICQGQKLLPVSTEASIGTTTRAGNSEFILIKEFDEATHDTPINPEAVARFKWGDYHNNANTVAQAWYQINASRIENHISQLEQAPVTLEYEDCMANYTDTVQTIYLGPPTEAGQQSIAIARTANIQINMRYTTGSRWQNYTETYTNASVNVWFTSQAY